MLPPGQVGAMQTTVVIGRAHSVRFVPLQRPSQSADSPAPAHNVRGDTGCWPAVVGTQVPVLSQVSHWPSQARSQHTSSGEQKSWHWLSAVQGVPPTALNSHAPPLQNAVISQSVSLPQSVRQSVAAQA